MGMDMPRPAPIPPMLKPADLMLLTSEERHHAENLDERRRQAGIALNRSLRAHQPEAVAAAEKLIQTLATELRAWVLLVEARKQTSAAN